MNQESLIPLSLETISILTLNALAEMGINAPALTHEHAPYQVLNAEDFNSRYFIEDVDDWST